MRDRVTIVGSGRCAGTKPTHGHPVLENTHDFAKYYGDLRGGRSLPRRCLRALSTSGAVRSLVSERSHFRADAFGR